eukprot:scaffold185962_cov32-Tisochrysis_lutea.AAC.4
MAIWRAGIPGPQPWGRQQVDVVEHDRDETIASDTAGLAVGSVEELSPVELAPVFRLLSHEDEEADVWVDRLCRGRPAHKRSDMTEEAGELRRAVLLTLRAKGNEERHPLTASKRTAPPRAP